MAPNDEGQIDYDQHVHNADCFDESLIILMSHAMEHTWAERKQTEVDGIVDTALLLCHIVILSMSGWVQSCRHKM